MAQLFTPERSLGRPGALRRRRATRLRAPFKVSSRHFAHFRWGGKYGPDNILGIPSLVPCLIFFTIFAVWLTGALATMQGAWIGAFKLIWAGAIAGVISRTAPQQPAETSRPCLASAAKLSCPPPGASSSARRSGLVPVLVPARSCDRSPFLDRPPQRTVAWAASRTLHAPCTRPGVWASPGGWASPGVEHRSSPAVPSQPRRAHPLTMLHPLTRRARRSRWCRP